MEAAPELRITPDEWDEVLGDAAGPQIVVGGPGTGKTEFLVRRAAHLVLEQGVPSDAVLALSFGRRGVADLKRRIHAQFSRPVAPMPVVTFHSLARDIVEVHATERGWAMTPQILTGPEQTALVRELLTSEDPKRWSLPFRSLLDTVTFADEVTDFLLRASEQMFTAEDIAAMATARDDWHGMPSFMVRYRSELERRGRIDYGLLLAEAAAIADAGLAELERYRYVLVDEYQDTTVAQAGLLRGIVAHHRNLTVAADPYQSIYSFRGATLQNVARFPDAFTSADGASGRRIILTTSFRTPHEILDAAERVTAHAIPGAAGPVTPAPGSGRVDIHIFDQQTAEAEWIAGEVQRLHLEEQLPYARVAVFVRSKRRFIPELSRALLRRGIAHDSPTSRLAEQPAVRFILDLVAAATSPDAAGVGRALRRVLLGPWFSVTLGELHDIERHGRAMAVTWPEALRQTNPELAELAQLAADPAWAAEIPAVDAVWHVWSTLPQLAHIATSEQQDDRMAWASLSQVIGRWNERNPAATLLDYRRLLLEEEFEAQPLLSFKAPETDALTVTTLHQAKGLEFDVVFIADAVEGVFPDLRIRDSLLGVRHLLPDVPREPSAYRQFRLQEERRLAYTAMTRAARRVVLTATSSGFEEGRGIPSRFLALAAGAMTVQEAAMPIVSDRPPVTHAEGEAMLRRIVGNPAAARPERLAALDVLASGTKFGLRDPWLFGGLRKRGAHSGVVPAELRLSPTQADAYLRCPHAYALKRRLGVGDRAGPHAEVGKLVHSALEMAGRHALQRGDPRSTVTDAMSALDELFDPTTFGVSSMADAWRSRAEIAITTLYEKWPSDGRLVDVERRFEIDLGGVKWVGVVDRIEARGSALAIVDYKTSSSMVSQAEAAASIQLGFYMLAAAEDAALAEHGPPIFAEYWYPYASRRLKGFGKRTFDPANLELVREQLLTAAAGIRGEEWTPLPSRACERCPVRTVCPAQPEGVEGFVA